MKFKKILISIITMLIFLCAFIPKSSASFFFNDEDKEESSSEIIKTIDEDEGRTF